MRRGLIRDVRDVFEDARTMAACEDPDLIDCKIAEISALEDEVLGCLRKLKQLIRAQGKKQ